MEDATNPPRLPSNCTSPVCSDPAHDDFALHAEWSDESSDCVGDGPHRDGQDDREDRDDPEDLDDFDEEEGSQEVQEHLLSFFGATAPEILRLLSLDSANVPNHCSWISSRPCSQNLTTCLGHQKCVLELR